MINQQLVDYINQSRQSGMSDERIIQTLLSSGWPEQDIKMAIGTVNAAPNYVNQGTSVSQSSDQEAFISKWSWGGFLLYVVYFLGSRNYKRAFLYFLGNFVPILNIYLWIKAGIRGRKLVWESGKWLDFELYKKRQVLLDKIGIILAFIILLILAGFGIFALTNKSSTEALEDTKSSTKPLEVANMVLANKNIIEKQNCGSIRDEAASYLVFDFPPLSPLPSIDEKKAVACMDEALEACKPASLIMTKNTKNNVETVETEIIGKDGDNCVISQNNFGAPDETTICKVPISFIQDIIKKAKQADENPFLGVSTHISFEGTEFDNNEVNFDCVMPKPHVDLPHVDLKVDYDQVINSEGPVTVTKPLYYFYLHWDGNLYTKSCEASGSWSGVKSTFGGFSFSSKVDSGKIDLKKSFEKQGMKATNVAAGEYIFRLTCSNQSGTVSDEIKVYVK